MTQVFVDTSGFYAHLDPTDDSHAAAAGLLRRSAAEAWPLVTTNYVLMETMALIQSRLGWEAVDQWTSRVLPHCQVAWIDEELHRRGEARWAHARERRLSLTDCISFEFMRDRGIRAAIAFDEHFERSGFRPPAPQ